ncbi:MAG: response regulator [Steroidobacteraceae bacterium]
MSESTCRILVADDNVDAGDALAMLLELQGHEVKIARDGHSAVKLAAEFRPDIALLDIGMPGMDGFATARAIRAEDWGKDLYLVALTGYSQPADRERANLAGIDVFIVKPVEMATLEQVCAQALSRN